MSQTAPLSANGAYRLGFIPRSLAASLTTGVVIGMMEVFFALSLATLVFRGSLESHLSQGMGLALVSSAFMLIIIALTSSRPGTFAVVQDVPVVLMAVIASQVAAVLSPALVLPTLFVLIATTSVLTGSAMALIGQLKLSGLIRYMPYPVVGGFLAATGWLLVTGAFPIMTGTPLTLASVPVLFQPSQLILWLPGVTIALAVFVVIRFARHPLALPVMLVGTLAVYHLVLWLSGTSLEQATTLGLFSASPITIKWEPVTPAAIQLVVWDTIWKQAGNITVLISISLVGLLLNVSAIELVVNHEYNLDNEMRSTGLANILTGLAGGFVGYHVVSNTSIASRVGLRDRVAPLVSGLTCLVMVFFNPPMLILIPKALFAGMILALGIDFLYDWVLIGWKRFARAEYAGVLLILVVIVITDFLTGVLVGLLAMVILFAIGYSRVRVILRIYSAGEVFSKVERPEKDNLLLKEYGNEVLVYELQGFLFFGTANVLLDTLKQRLAHANRTAPAYLLVDFHAVTGIDSSTALSFQRTLQLAEEKNIFLVLTGASQQVRERLNLSTQKVFNRKLRIIEDIDHGLEWCENQVLARHGQPASSPIQVTEVEGTISQAMRNAGLDEEMISRIAPYVNLCAFDTGAVVIREGDPAEELYLLASGRVSVFLNTENGPYRLRTLGPGNFFGEIAILLKNVRTANVNADEPSVVISISKAAMEQISRTDPPLFSSLYELISHQLAQRIRKDDTMWLAMKR